MKLQSVLSDSAQPIHRLLSEEVVSDLLRQRFDYGKPWFGQLMAGPQMLAYLWQVNQWLETRRIRISL